MYYVPNYNHKVKKKGKNKKLLWFLTIVVIGYIFYRGIIVAPSLFNSAFKTIQTAHLFQKQNKPKINLLEKAVKSSLQDAKGTYAVAIRNLKTNESYAFNTDKTFPTASLYKAWIMAIVFQQIEQGKLTEEQDLSADIADLNREFNIPPDLAEQTTGTLTYTVDEALDKMITISDNYAALLLADTIQYKAINAFLNKNNLTHSAIGIGDADPTTSASDMIVFFQKLYKGKLANKNLTDKMVTLLKKTEFNTVIPKLLPAEASVAHKTGTLDTYSHDAGIVFSPTGDYVIALLSDTDAPPAAEERMATISKNVYDYFVKKAAANAEAKRQQELEYKMIATLLTITSIVVLATICFILVKMCKRKSS